MGTGSMVTLKSSSLGSPVARELRSGVMMVVALDCITLVGLRTLGGVSKALSVSSAVLASYLYVNHLGLDWNSLHKVVNEGWKVAILLLMVSCALSEFKLALYTLFVGLTIHLGRTEPMDQTELLLAMKRQNDTLQRQLASVQFQMMAMQRQLDAPVAKSTGILGLRQLIKTVLKLYIDTGRSRLYRLLS